MEGLIFLLLCNLETLEGSVPDSAFFYLIVVLVEALLLSLKTILSAHYRAEKACKNFILMIGRSQYGMNLGTGSHFNPLIESCSMSQPSRQE